MENDYKLMFIKNKLQQIKSAVMYAANSNITRLPNDIVEFETIDEDGLLWFTAHVPKQWIKAYELHFPAKLIFYRKGVEYYVEINGTAVVVNKQEAMYGDTQGGKLLLKMVPYYMEYTETGRKEPGFKKWRSQLQEIFMNTMGLNKETQPRLTELH